MDARPSPDRLSQILDSVEKISRFCVVGNSSVNLRNEWLISSTHCVLPAKFGIFPFIFPNKRELVRRPVRIRLRTPPSSRSKPQISGPAPNRPFLWGFSPVSFRSFGLWWHWWSLRPISASRLCIQKFRSPQQGFDGQYRLAVGNIVSLRQKKPCRAGRNYCGFNPSTSNCRLHSAGASRNRSTPIPRGSRPSTPARTRSGARNASEMVMLTWRTLHF
jgi:hypothetical protein